jgi:hypothetical protein
MGHDESSTVTLTIYSSLGLSPLSIGIVLQRMQNWAYLQRKGIAIIAKPGGHSAMPIQTIRNLKLRYGDALKKVGHQSNPLFAA